MKILIVITKSEIGGAQVFALNLAKGLKSLGEEVVVAGGPGDFLPFELERAGIDFYRFRNLKRGFNPFKNLAFLKELKKYVKDNNFDVVHLNSTNALLGAWPLRCLKKKLGAKKLKVVFTVHGLSLIDGGHKAGLIIKKLFRAFFKLAFKKLDKIVFVSRLNLDFALSDKLLNKKTSPKSTLIYNGLDISEHYFVSRDIARKFLERLLREKFNNFEQEGRDLKEEIKKEIKKEELFGDEEIFSADAFIYGSIGRLAYPKNYEFLIENHKKVLSFEPKAKLVIIGEGPERSKYEGLIKVYGLEKSVFLLGEMREASRYLQAFDLFILPSVFEGLSLSLIEAKISGIKTLASRVGGNEEILGERLCFNLNDREDYLNKFREVLASGLKEDVKEGSGEKSETNLLAGGEEEELAKFSAKKMSEKYLEFYLN